MTKKQLKELEKLAHASLAELLTEMTAVLERHGITGMRISSFEMKMTAKPPESASAALLTNQATKGCVILPNGDIFCG